MKNWNVNILSNRYHLKWLGLFTFIFHINHTQAQYKPLTQSQAMAEMERFGSGKRVLYMAAHPDDENTRLIAWLSNALDAETTYLSLTRGSGGQNLIGDELGAELGVIREHELRAARSVDGGNQRFTDALDFGYSKSVDEVWNKWDYDDLQLQAVRTIRELKPDFIITRFPPDERAGHGHHTASAELAIKCAELAADEKYDTVTEAWSVQGVWWNTSIWWDPTLKDDPEAVYADMSGFDPLLGDTYGAIGDAARSMHKCQGFGVPINRGPREEYFKKLWGGGDLSSYLVPDRGADAQSLLAQDAAFALGIGDQKQAIAKWADLGKVLLEDTTPESDKYQRWQHVMLHLLGVYAEVFTTVNPIPKSSSYPATLVLQALNFDIEVQFASLKAPNKDMGFNPAQVLTSEGQELEVNLYDEGKITKYIRVRLEYESAIILLYLKPVAKLSDRAIGEYREAIAVEPSIHAKFDQTVYWNTRKKGCIGYSIYSKDGGELSWSLDFRTPAWRPAREDDQYIELEKREFLSNSMNRSETLNAGWNHFTEEIPAKMEAGKYHLFLAYESHTGKFFPKTLDSKRTISYPHIGTHYLYYPASSVLTVLDLNKKRIKVGYIEGAGDLMDETLESVGYDVVRITEETPELWDEVDAILVGIRAFNTEAWLMESEERIKSFVANGGNFVVTYTTAGRSGMALPLPVPLTVGRDRVTEEEAPVALNELELLQKPNALSEVDFEQWVQERGLYFPSKYEGYTTALSITESTGIVYENSTVVAEYGKGSVIYTGLSLFRELPKGVPGALRLLQNILHYDR